LRASGCLDVKRCSSASRERPILGLFGMKDEAEVIAGVLPSAAQVRGVLRTVEASPAPIQTRASSWMRWRTMMRVARMGRKKRAHR